MIYYSILIQSYILSEWVISVFCNLIHSYIVPFSAWQFLPNLSLVNNAKSVDQHIIGSCRPKKIFLGGCAPDPPLTVAPS